MPKTDRQKAILVLRFGQMRVEAAVMLFRQFATGAHQGFGDGEGRAGCKRHLDHRARAALVILADDALAIGEDLVLLLHHAVGRQAAVLLRKVIEPRVTVMRMPSLRASSTWMSIASSRSAGKR
jgi:hypothetical protein